jgi:hypothetical protein
MFSAMTLAEYSASAPSADSTVYIQVSKIGFELEVPTAFPKQSIFPPFDSSRSDLISFLESQFGSSVIIVGVIGDVVAVLRNIWALFVVLIKVIVCRFHVWVVIEVFHLGAGAQSFLNLSVEFLTSLDLIWVSEFLFCQTSRCTPVLILSVSL